jgi:hypothetical protein
LLLFVDALDGLLSSESFMVDSEEVLLQILFTLRHPLLLRHIRWEFVSAAAIASLCEDPALFHPTESLWLTIADRLAYPSPPPSPEREIDSLILSDFPPLSNEFRRKRFQLLWRGSRDGFAPGEFHRRCDGRANTQTLIVDTDGNVFGGFTPVEWESLVWNGKIGHNDNCQKGDDSLRSFAFTLKNPHGVLPRKFALMAEWKHYAIMCYSARGPVFGGCSYVDDNCNTNRDSYTHFGTNWSGRAYANDTAFADFLTGADKFTVKEIEVFEIAD